jgi:hypothetical protein
MAVFTLNTPSSYSPTNIGQRRHTDTIEFGQCKDLRSVA